MKLSGVICRSTGGRFSLSSVAKFNISNSHSSVGRSFRRMHNSFRDGAFIATILGRVRSGATLKGRLVGQVRRVRWIGRAVGQ